MEATFLTKVVLPLALFVIMLGMGLSLVPDDFRRVLRHPKAVAIGASFQMLALPLLGFAFAKIFGLEGALAVGLVTLALCPGGTTSNMFSFLSRGDVALSISLTAVVSLITPFTIPLLLGPAMTHFMGEAAAVKLPIGQTIVQLLAITVVPVGIGMFVRHKAPSASRRAEGAVKVLSIVFLFAVIGGIMRQNWDKLPGFFAQAGLSSLALNVVGMALGYFGAKSLKLGERQSITIGLEVGIQNGTTALLVTSTILQNPIMSIAPAIYSLIMFATGAIFGIFVARRVPKDADTAPPATVPSAGE